MALKLASWAVGAARLAENYTTCEQREVSYAHRVDDPESYDWCIVPDSGYDGVLFAGVALLAACCLQGRFSALWILLAGAACQAVAFPVNTGRWGNALAIWLGITPADVFLYIFLPPMLVDAAVRISYFHFRKLLLHVISFAFLMVLASTAVMVPVLLWVFRLQGQGWAWQHAALFAAMTASTDAVAVGAILKAGGSVPERLILILEGESLFNDATSITLFEIMLAEVNRLGQAGHGSGGPGAQIAHIAGKIAWLSMGGLAAGLAFGFATRQILKLVKRGGHNAPEQLSLSLAMAYLAFYVSQVAGVSGVIAVVVYGLYGSSSAKWGMSSAVTESPVFAAFWDTLGFILNGIVFFYAGASSVNFFWRSSQELYMSAGSLHVLLVTFWRLPLVYAAMLVIRGACICLLNPLFRAFGSHMSAAEVAFSTAGGLRGAISLILAQMLVTQLSPDPEAPEQQRVIAQIALWTAGVVSLTLLINAPLLPALIRWTGLADVSPVKARMRARAARALVRYTKAAVHDLQHDEDEMLRGVDWNTVRRETDMSQRLAHLQRGAEPARGPAQLPRGGAWRLLHFLCCCFGVRKAEESRLLQPLLEPRFGRLAGGSSDGSGGEDSDSEAAEQDPPQQRGGRRRPRQCGADIPAHWQDAELQEQPPPPPQQQQQPQQPQQGGGPASAPVAARGQLLGRARSGGADFELGQDASMVADLPFSRELAGKVRRAEEQLQSIDVRGSASPGNGAAPRMQASSAGRGRQAQQQPDVLWEGEQQQAQAAGRHRGGWAAPRREPALGASSSSSSAEDAASEGEAWAPQRWEGAAGGNGGGGGRSGEGPSPRLLPRFRGTLKRDSNGNAYTVLPQPVLRPRMVRPGEETGAVQQPAMRWMSVDLAEYRRQQQRDAAARRSDAQPRSLLARPSLHARTSVSDNKMLKRAMSGPFALPPGRPGKDSEAPEVAEARARLVGGLKRYFHGKRAEGLLSARGVQLLDYACDAQMDAPDRPLAVFALLEREVCGGPQVRLLSRALFSLRRCGMVVRGWRPRWLWEPLLRLPLRTVCRVLAGSLSSAMLGALEVAVEYWLALSWAPQAQWLAESEQASPLQAEVKSQRQQVWAFIINREVEAPARFQAIQTYRAAMAVLRQQQHFVAQLHSTGVVDDAERSQLLGPLQRQERRLQRRGPHWRTPSISEVLRNLAFLAHLPRGFFDAVVSRGLLLRFGQGEVVWAPPHAAAHRAPDGSAGGDPCERSGIYIVIAGLISRSFRDADGHTDELLMGSGGVFGLTSALVGESLPGSGPAVGVGNALSSGPVLFHWPQAFIDELEAKAARGLPAWCQLRLDLYRMAGLFVVERLRGEALAAAVTHFQHLALSRTRRRALRRLTKRFDAACPRDKAGQLWQRLRGDEAARKLVGKELGSALDSLTPEAEQEAGDGGPSEERGLGAAPGDGGLLTDQDMLGCMDAERLWQRVRKLAAAALADLKEAVRDARLLQLGPHEVMQQRSSLVLLRGTLHTAGRATYLPPEAGAGGGSLASASSVGSLAGESSEAPSSPGSNASQPEASQGGGAPAAAEGPDAWEVTVAYKGPSVLPWLWQEVTAGGETLLRPQPIPFRAGPDGAVLLVCEAAGEESESSQDGASSPGGPSQQPADVLAGLSRPSPGSSLGRVSMQAQGIPDRQVRFADDAAPAWQQQPLAEGAENETFGNAGSAPSAFEQGRRKQLRVLSIRPM